ncbi:DUF3231 family protein [Metabacillus malikii]|uniref:DUF3231 family protein n=1 Tax=Metabacillus malikii TaxID=1504265 RepID=A0ABT9ZI85_9BACI|nr:DUF3231 family protein [Metabacillus malikii]MDQ0231991.1 hypothetical protein [Metabacillus malikii]
MDEETKQIDHEVRLTAPEIANIWTQYQNDTMAICIYKYMKEIIEDKAIHNIISFALQIAEGHIETVKGYFVAENYPIPHGFTEDDVNVTAPRLFSDEFCLTYTYIMSVYGLAGYAAALTTNVRRDIRNYFVQCQDETMELFNQSLDLLLEKGVFSRPPHIVPPKSYEFIESNHFLKGVLGGERLLNCVEISNIHWDLKKLQLDKALCMAFAQVAKTEDAKKFIWRGVEISSKMVEVQASILAKEHLPQPKSEEAEITDSTTPPFSDRLMMYHKLLVGSATIGLFGSAIATCQRYDLSTHYSRFTIELADYMKDGFKIMVKHKWLEQIPLTIDREELTSGRQNDKK